MLTRGKGVWGARPEAEVLLMITTPVHHLEILLAHLLRVLLDAHVALENTLLRDVRHQLSLASITKGGS